MNQWLISAAVLTPLVVVIVWGNIRYRRHLKRMTPEQRARHEAAIEEMKPW